MSTEHQQYSIDNQVDTIARYAQEHVMEVVRTYTDGGKSGLTIQRREGLRQLIEDVETGAPGFSAILVYDVSRWGRFQDADESAYYEYRCKRAHINVHYCAETFANDSSVSSTLLKTLKRTMAGEFSRELSVKVFAGKCRLVERGFRQGGPAGYGLRRLLIDREGNAKKLLDLREWKSISTDRVVLIPGPAEEVKVVQDIYRQFIDEHKSMPAIAATLNQRGIPTGYDRLWTRQMVSSILTNPKYIGANVTNRKSFKLKVKRVSNPPEMWVRRDGAFPAVVSVDTFNRAQEVLAALNRRYTDDELLELLKRLLARTGKLSGPVIDAASDIPSLTVYGRRFGGLLKAFERIGYTPQHDYSYVANTAPMMTRHQERIEALVEDLRGVGHKVDLAKDVLTINGELCIRFVNVRCVRDGSGHRWFFYFDASPICDITVAARLDPDHLTVLDYYIVPRAEKLGRVIYRGTVNSILSLYRFPDLSVLRTLIRRTRLPEAT